jgi:hypothetical protein
MDNDAFKLGHGVAKDSGEVDENPFDQDGESDQHESWLDGYYAYVADHDSTRLGWVAEL